MTIEDDVLAEMTAEWGLGPEHAEAIRGTLAYQGTVLDRQLRQLGRDASLPVRLWARRSRKRLRNSGALGWFLRRP